MPDATRKPPAGPGPRGTVAHLGVHGLLRFLWAYAKAPAGVEAVIAIGDSDEMGPCLLLEVPGTCCVAPLRMAPALLHALEQACEQFPEWTQRENMRNLAKHLRAGLAEAGDPGASVHCAAAARARPGGRACPNRAARIGARWRSASSIA